MHYSSGPGVIPHPLPEVNLLMVEIRNLKPYIFMIRVTRQIKCLIAQAPRVIPHPLTEVIFLMVEILTPKPYIFMIRVNRQIKCPKSWDRGHPHPLPEVFLRITHISETILSILTKLCPNVPWVILFQSYSLVSYLFIKQDQMILTCNSAVASLMLSQFFLLSFIKQHWRVVFCPQLFFVKWF